MHDQQFTPQQRDRIQRIRAEIADGNYDTPERLEAAVEIFAGLLEDGGCGLRPTDEAPAPPPRAK